MTRRRYELTDHEWSILSPLLPNKPRGVEWYPLAVPDGLSLGGNPGALWSADHLLQPLRPLAESRCLGPAT